ncbi:hypothetical protein FGB62_190g017 [Gracilaria domingensis]|nr:hypothetical protein FGB62_190g017 [Gracilaria domingensis]
MARYLYSNKGDGDGSVVIKSIMTTSVGAGSPSISSRIGGNTSSGRTDGEGIGKAENTGSGVITGLGRAEPGGAIGDGMKSIGSTGSIVTATGSGLIIIGVGIGVRLTNVMKNLGFLFGLDDDMNGLVVVDAGGGRGCRNSAP